jgi:hypothetical protein
MNVEINCDFIHRIQRYEVQEALKRMRLKKAVGPDGIPIEAWKFLRKIGVAWSTSLFNNIFRVNKIPTKWRKSTLIPLYKNKGDVQIVPTTIELNS